MKVKEESEKAGLKFNIQKTNIMASGPISSWQIEVETMETVTDFIFLGSKITADGYCSHEMKKYLLLRRKAVTNLDSILKSRDIAWHTKVHILKTMLFPVVMYGWESWTIKKDKHQRIDAFELWFWRSLLRVPWTARKSNHSILKEISPECLSERLMLKLKLSILWLPITKNWLIGKDPDADKDWRQEEKGMTEDKMVGWHHWLDGQEFEHVPGVGYGQGRPACCSPWGRRESDINERLNWTEQNRLGQPWEVLCHSTFGVPIGKKAQEVPLLCGWDGKDCSSGCKLLSSSVCDQMRKAALVFC